MSASDRQAGQLLPSSTPELWLTFQRPLSAPPADLISSPSLLAVGWLSLDVVVRFPSVDLHSPRAGFLPSLGQSNGTLVGE